MDNNFFLSIGLTLKEFKNSRFYLNVLLPLTIIPVLVLLGFLSLLFGKISPLILFSYAGLLFLILTFLLYYTNYKTTQHLIIDKMHTLLKKKDKPKLEEKDKIMTLLINKKSFWFGYLNYITFWIFIVLILMLIFGFSRLFYYNALKEFVKIIGYLTILFFVSYLNPTFFTTLKFYDTLRKLTHIRLFWIKIFSVDLLFVAIFFALSITFAYLIPIYLGIIISIIITFNTAYFLQEQ